MCVMKLLWLLSRLLSYFLATLLELIKALKMDEQSVSKGMFKLLKKHQELHTNYIAWHKHADLSEVVCSLKAGVSLCLFSGFMSCKARSNFSFLFKSSFFEM